MVVKLQDTSLSLEKLADILEEQDPNEDAGYLVRISSLLELKALFPGIQQIRQVEPTLWSA